MATLLLLMSHFWFAVTVELSMKRFETHNVL